MLISTSPGRRARRIVVGVALLSAVPFAMVRAQYPTGAVVQSLPSADDPAERLATALRTLAVSPNNLGALIAAGQNALILGDPNAAVGFFAHASEIAPRDGRVKAGLGGALVALEKPQDALRYFQEASTLGVADVDLAEDRGLAYDLVGDPARAQRDYQTVLAVRPGDDATRRRLALSQGISGNRAGAIATLDPLIRKRDIAAWRAQTFVLAMTGDAKGANDITRIMLPSQQAMLQPFLVRLAALSPADKARAVHFGEMPAAGRSYSGAQLAAPTGIAPTYAPPVAIARAAPVRMSAPQPAAPIPTAPTPQPAPAAQIASAVVASPPVVDRPAAPAGSPVAAAPPAAGVAQADGATHVVANGVPMRRIEHSAQEIFALGMPRYEYIPAGAPARPSPERQTAASAGVATPAATIAPTPVTAEAPPPPTQIAAATPMAGPSIAPASPSAGPVMPAALAAAGSSSPPAAVALPLGSSAVAGHYDLPHESGPSRAVPRSVQPTARAPVSRTGADPAESPAPAPATAAEPVRVAASPRPPIASEDAGAPANPTIVAARRAHATQTPVKIASTGPTRGHNRAETPAPDDDKTVETRAKPGKGAVSRSDDAAASEDRTDGRGKGRKGAVSRSDEATASEDRTDGRGKARKVTVSRSDDTAVSEDRADGRGKARKGAVSRSDEATASEDRADGRSKGRKGAVSRPDDATASEDRADGRGKGRKSRDLPPRTRDGDDTQDRTARHDGRRHEEPASSKARTRSSKVEAPATPRVYVQVAGGANKADMDKAWAGVKAKAPELMKGRTPSTTPLHATNRLLVGPFKSDDEAQAFVNKMAGKGLSGFTFKSGKGQKIDTVGKTDKSDRSDRDR